MADSLDAGPPPDCIIHDDYYDRAARSADPEAALKRYDEIFVEEVRRLPEDPRQRNNPPDNIQDGKDMRKETIYWFWQKNRYQDMEDVYGEEYMYLNYYWLYILFTNKEQVAP